MYLRFILVFVAVVSLCPGANAQTTSTLYGVTLDSIQHEPLPFANIFVNNTTIGTSSDQNGNFTLKNLPSGYNEIVFSYVGYQSRIIKFFVSPGANLNVGNISLVQRLDELAEVQVKEKRDKDWERKFKKFEKIFLGENNNSSNCKIQNPWVINFSENSSKTTLEASANEPIEIFNYSLGYKIYFYMAGFSADLASYQILGQFRFEEAEALDDRQTFLWRKNRIDTYNGSERHLLKSILDGQSEEEGFKLYVDKPGYALSSRSDLFSAEINKSIIKYDLKDKVKKGNAPNEFTVELPPRIEVHYVNEYATHKYYRDVPFQVSWLEVNGDLKVNANGVVMNSIDLVTSGVISGSRVADLLPLNFTPNVEVGNATVRTIPKLAGWSKYKRMQEFVYVATDKPYYYPGERIWMKGSLLYNDNELLDSLSKVLYVELVNDQQVCVARKYLQIDSAIATGYIDLPDSTGNGNYIIRAYTNWMRNFGSQSFYTKPLPILGLTDKVMDDNVSYDTSSLLIRFQPNKERYNTRDSIGMTLQVTDQRGNPIAANLSVSVTDAVIVKSVANQSTILDFKRTESRMAVNAEFVVNYPVETGIAFSGLFRDDRGKPQKTDVSIVQRDFNTIIPTETDDQGVFHVTGLNFNGTMNFGFQALSKKGKPYGNFSLLKKDFPVVDTKPPLLLLNIKDMNDVQVPITTYTPGADTRVLQNVEVRGSTIEPYTPQNVPLYGAPDYAVKGEDLRQVFTGSNLIQALQGKIPGLRVSYGWDENNQDTYRVRLRGGSSTMGAGLSSAEPLLIVDGMPFGGDPNISIANFISNIPVQTVERVEVITSAVSMLGTRGANGAIIIYTNNSGVNAGNKPVNNYPNMQVIPIEGFQAPTAFPAPSYGKERETGSTDLRTTIHWEPNLTTDSMGNAPLSFYAADLEGLYRVVVEGLSEDGRPLRGEYMITIENR